MIWLYRILFIPALIIAMPYYAMRMIRRGGYAKDFSHRFGGQKNLPAPANGKSRIWIQAVSVGEVEALAPLVEKLSATPDIELVITTTTSTGYKILRDKYAPKCLYVGVFPMDFWLFSRRAWNKIKPTMAVLMEGELWPEHMHQAKARKVPLMLINARMSDKSFARYLRIKFFARRLLDKFVKIGASSELDMSRFIALGVSPSRIFVSGNLKFDTLPSAILSKEEKLALRREMGFDKESLVILGSSTWPGEEKMLIDAMNRLRGEGFYCHLLIVPRHAERRNEILPLIKDFPHAQRSVQRQAAPGTLIYLADTTGEMKTLAQVADMAFIGKSLSPNIGGQTPIDCAALGVPMIYGPYMTNFRRVCETLERENAAIKVPDAPAAIAELTRLAQSPELRDTLAQAAKKWHQSNIGAADRTYDAIVKIISAK